MFPPCTVAPIVMLKPFKCRTSLWGWQSLPDLLWKVWHGFHFLLGSLLLPGSFPQDQSGILFLLKNFFYCQAEKWLLCLYCILPHSWIFFTNSVEVFYVLDLGNHNSFSFPEISALCRDLRSLVVQKTICCCSLLPFPECIQRAGTTLGFQGGSGNCFWEAKEWKAFVVYAAT